MGTETAEWKKGCGTPFLYGMTDLVNYGIAEFDGLPGLSSSFIDSRPSQNLLCHLNTIDLETCIPSPAVPIICLVSVGDFPRLTQNLITARCSKLWFFASILEDAISVNYHCTRCTQCQIDFNLSYYDFTSLFLCHLWSWCNSAHFMMVK